MPRITSVIALIGLIGLLWGTALADGVMRSQLANDPQKYLKPVSSKVSVKINGQVATTVTQQQFVNASDSTINAKYSFPLPGEASAAGFAHWVGGERIEATIIPGEQDTSLVSVPGVPDDYELRSYLGDNPFFFLIKDIAPHDTVKVELTYIELLPYDSGYVDYIYPLNSGQFAPAPLDTFMIDVKIESQRLITSFASPSHPGSEISHGDYTGSASFLAAGVRADTDYRLEYSVSQKELGLFILTHRPNEDEDGFFLIIIEPDPGTSQEEIIDKVFTFIVDVSGSMGGIKIAQAKEAARYCIGNLNREDYFNVIKYNDQIYPFRQQPLEATNQNVAEALSFIDAIRAGGMTNINGALLWALAQEMGATTANIFIFLTDGLPTAGVTDPDQILANVRQDNTPEKNVNIFVFGIGYDVNQYLLTSLADRNRGFAEYILENEDVGGRISDFYRRIRNPLLTDISVDYGSIHTEEVFPYQIPNIYVGQQLLLMGRYSGGGSTNVTLSGKTFGSPVFYPYAAEFTDVTDENAFIPRIWAKSKIDYLEDWIIINGENEEIIGEIIRLSQKYGIQSKYTHFGERGGETEEEYEEGMPVSVESTAFRASVSPEGIFLEWKAISFHNIRGFNVLRSNSPDGPYERLNDNPITDGRFVDTGILTGSVYYYKLEEIGLEGESTLGILKVVVAEITPKILYLSQNFPNPFNPVTEIRYQLPESGYAKLEVYNLTGQKVRTLADGFHRAGGYFVRWDGTDDAGLDVGSGIYFCRLELGHLAETRKMILAK